MGLAVVSFSVSLRDPMSRQDSQARNSAWGALKPYNNSNRHGVEVACGSTAFSDPPKIGFYTNRKPIAKVKYSAILVYLFIVFLHGSKKRGVANIGT